MLLIPDAMFRVSIEMGFVSEEFLRLTVTTISCF